MAKRARGRRSLAARLGALALLVAAILVTFGAGSASAQRVVYVSSGFPAGSQNITALAIGANGALTPVAGSPFSTGGSIVEGLAITPEARRLYVAAFGTNDIRGFTVGANGTLSTIPGSPFTGATNPLGVAPAPDSSRLYVWNHGSSIGSWTIGANGALTQVPGSPFAVPATQANPFAGSVAPDGDHLYVPNENSIETVAGCGGTCEVNRVTPYAVAPGGALAPIQGPGVITGTTNVKAGGPNPFGSAITPDGRFLYVSNPEDGTFGTISAFAVNPDGTLTTQLPGFPLSTGPGNHPLGMAITPDGRFLYVATRITNSVNAYSINANGTLTTVPGSPFATGGTNGKALAVTPDGRRLYVSNNGSNNVSGFTIATNGSLTLIAGSPWATGGTNPDLESIVITPNQAPVADFDVIARRHGQATQFNATFSTDQDGTVARYSWDYGDGNTDPNGGPTPSHVYAAPGTYMVTLTVTDNEGCSVDRVFTGKATLCNGQATARTTRQVVVQPTTCRGRTATIVGTQGADALTGTAGRDVIAALGGNDRVSARGGNDLVCGDQGNDRLGGGAGRDSVFGEAGNDTVSGNAGNDRLFGNAGRDRLFGNAGNDALFGGPGRDRLDGGPGRNVLRP